MLFHLAWELPNFVSSSFVFPLEPELCFRSINFVEHAHSIIFSFSLFTGLAVVSCTLFRKCVLETQPGLGVLVLAWGKLPVAVP